MVIILVPGLWLDGSSWGDVVPVLERAGHRAVPVTLPGMGARDADRSGISLRDHVEAVAGLVDAADPADGPVVLVGHSGGGSVVHGAVDARPDRVARAVYVDCWPTGDGDVVNDELPVVDGEIPLPDWSFFEPEDLVDLDDEARAAFRDRAVPSPARVATDPQRLGDGRRYDVPVTIIACEFTAARLREWMASGAEPLKELAAVRHVDYADLPTGHWPQLTRPRDLGQAILEAVER
jgi:pimeloyl-ACP methyl ester carboxylesterase